MAKKGSKKAKEPSIQPGLWETMPAWKKHASACIVLIVLSFVFFAPVHFSGKSLIGGDTISWRAMAESMIEHRETTGDEPLWATNPFGGMPGYFISYHRTVPQIDDIFAMLRKVMWPSSHFIVSGRV